MQILLVEDDEDDYVLTRELLQEIYGSDHKLDWVQTVPEARRRIALNSHDIYFFDHRLGEHDGLELVHEVRSEARNTATPIILLTGLDDRAIDIEAMDAGATDYLVKKNIDAPSLERAIRYAIKQKKAEALAEYRAFHDSLTDLPNRALLMDRLEQAVKRFVRHGHHGALLFLDLDKFKEINDTFGHGLGDDLLKEVAGLISKNTRAEDTLARLGGDEFVVLLPELSDDAGGAASAAEIVGEKIRRTLAQPMIIEDRELLITASIGITVLSGSEDSAENILRQADAAMYEAKAAGGNTYRLFVPEMEQPLIERIRTQDVLEQTLEKQSFELFLEPQVMLENRRQVGAGLLISWRDQNGKMVGPRSSVPSVKHSDVTRRIDEWVLRQACSSLKEWSRLPRLWVHISARQFQLDSFVDDIERVVKETGAPRERLALEIAESALVGAPDASAGRLYALRRLGFQLCIDQFGAHMASLMCLARMPVHRIKLDASVVNLMGVEEHQTKIASLVLGACRQLDMVVTADGVDDEATRGKLLDMGITVGQGGLFGGAIPAKEFFETLETEQDPS